MPVDLIVPGLVSTVIPVYNRALLLGEAVESVLTQSYRPIEVVIVDDGSTDDTPEAIAALCATRRGIVRGVRRENGGPGLARQSGLDIARGEFIQFLDSDDLLLPEKFAVQVQALAGNPAAVAAYGKTREYHIGEVPEDRASRRTGDRFTSILPLFLRERGWATSTPLYRRSALDLIGPWKDMRTEEDREYELRLAALRRPIVPCEIFVSDTRLHAGHRISRSDPGDRRKMGDRSQALRLMLEHARRAGIGNDAPEMQHFARGLFLLARQCGANGLPHESRLLLEAASDASLGHRQAGFAAQLHLYHLAARVVGWGWAGKAAEAFDALRERVLTDARGGRSAGLAASSAKQQGKGSR